MNKSILIADDHGVVRLALSVIIKKLRPGAIVDEVADFQEVLNIINTKKFDLIILDIKMPNGNFQQTLDVIKAKQPKTKIMVFSSQDESLFAVRYLKMGAHGFLHKLSNEEEINKALTKMLDKGSFISEEVKEAIIQDKLNKQKNLSNSINKLTEREMDVAKRLIGGVYLKDISNELNIHTSTVSTYKTRIFEKLDIQSISDLIKIFNLYEILD